jgi:hypothetical protein
VLGAAGTTPEGNSTQIASTIGRKLRTACAEPVLARSEAHRNLGVTQASFSIYGGDGLLASSLFPELARSLNSLLYPFPAVRLDVDPELTDARKVGSVNLHQCIRIRLRLGQATRVDDPACELRRDTRPPLELGRSGHVPTRAQLRCLGRKAVDDRAHDTEQNRRDRADNPQSEAIEPDACVLVEDLERRKSPGDERAEQRTHDDDAA